MSQQERKRFITEIGTFSAAGVERAAWGWDKHATGHLDSFHEAERAAYGAALALFARGHITSDQFGTLARPMDEALPWLLPKEPPHPYPVGDREV